MTVEIKYFTVFSRSKKIVKCIPVFFPFVFFFSPQTGIAPAVLGICSVDQARLKLRDPLVSAFRHEPLCLAIKLIPYNGSHSEPDHSSQYCPQEGKVK